MLRAERTRRQVAVTRCGDMSQRQIALCVLKFCLCNKSQKKNQTEFVRLVGAAKFSIVFSITAMELNKCEEMTREIK